MAASKSALAALAKRPSSWDPLAPPLQTSHTAGRATASGGLAPRAFVLDFPGDVQVAKPNDKTADGP